MIEHIAGWGCIGLALMMVFYPTMPEDQLRRSDDFAFLMILGYFLLLSITLRGALS